MYVSHGSMSALIDDIMRHKLDKFMKDLGRTEFQRKAWMQIDKSSSAWVTACPNKHTALNARQFPIMAQTYFGVAQQCLKGMVGQAILQKSGKKGQPMRETVCDPTARAWSKPSFREGGGRTITMT